MKRKPKNKEFFLFKLDLFCKDLDCQVYRLKKDDPSQIEICQTVCNFTSYDLHKWITSNGYIP